MISHLKIYPTSVIKALRNKKRKWQWKENEEEEQEQEQGEADLFDLPDPTGAEGLSIELEASSESDALIEHMEVGTEGGREDESKAEATRHKTGKENKQPQQGVEASSRQNDIMREVSCGDTLEREFEAWTRDAADSHTLTLETVHQESKGHKLITFSINNDLTFQLHCPLNYPTQQVIQCRCRCRCRCR